MKMPTRWVGKSLVNNRIRENASVTPKTPVTVEFFSRAICTLANGGTDEGAPGPRTFTPTAYAAYVRDPDGNKICAYSFTDE